MRVGFAVALGVLVYAVLLRVIRPTLWSSVLPPLLWAAAIGALAHTARRRYVEREAEQPPVGVQAAWMASQVMLRGLSVVYVCAFYSTAPQLLPLVGSDGLTPWAASFRSRAFNRLTAFKVRRPLTNLASPPLC